MTENPRFIKQEGALAEPPVSSGGTLRPQLLREPHHSGLQGRNENRSWSSSRFSRQTDSERSACRGLRQAFQRTAAGPRAAPASCFSVRWLECCALNAGRMWVSAKWERKSQGFQECGCQRWLVAIRESVAWPRHRWTRGCQATFKDKHT